MIPTTAFGLLLVHGALGSTIINVDVYYEVLCSDSVDFITNQLIPSYESLREHLNVNFIPYGKSEYDFDRETGQWLIVCQHGEKECIANREHSCVFYAISRNERADDRQQLSVEFLGCVMARDEPSEAGPNCSVLVGLTRATNRDIDTCLNSNLGYSLLAENGNRTNNVFGEPLSFVPTIVINGVYSSKTQEKALSNFRMVICRMLSRKERRHACNDGRRFW